MSHAPDTAPRGLFVTGTDTGVGKTLVAAGLSRFLAESGLEVGVMKPVESGVRDPEKLGEDGSLLCWASGCKESTDLVSPYRLSEPLAPSLAAARDGVEIKFSALSNAARTLSSRCDILIVEGAGGLLVPLNRRQMVVDLAVLLGYPVLTVCRAGLGTINHTLLTVEAARGRGLVQAGLIVNGMPEEPGLAERYAPAMLAEWTGLPVWGTLPRLEGGAARRRVELIAEHMSNMPFCRDLKKSIKNKCL